MSAIADLQMEYDRRLKLLESKIRECFQLVDQTMRLLEEHKENLSMELDEIKQEGLFSEISQIIEEKMTEWLKNNEIAIDTIINNITERFDKINEKN